MHKQVTSVIDNYQLSEDITVITKRVTSSRFPRHFIFTIPATSHLHELYLRNTIIFIISYSCNRIKYLLPWVSCLIPTPIPSFLLSQLLVANLYLPSLLLFSR